MFKSFSQLAIANVIKVCISIIQILFFATILTKEQYGIGSHLVAITIIVSGIASEKLRVTVLQGNTQKFFKSSGQLCIIIFLFCILVQFFLLDKASIATVILLLCASIAQSFVIIESAIYTNTGNISKLSLLTSKSAIIGLILSITSSWLYFSEYSLLLFYIYTSCSFIFLSIPSIGTSFNLMRSSYHKEKTSGSQMKYWTNSAMGITLTQAPLLLGNIYLNPQLFGSFALALRLVEFGLRLPTTIINTILATRFGQKTEASSYPKAFSQITKLFRVYLITGSIVLYCAYYLNPGITPKLDSAISQLHIIALIILLYGTTAHFFQHFLLSDKINSLVILNSLRMFIFLIFLNFVPQQNFVIAPITSYIMIDCIVCYALLSRITLVLPLMILNLCLLVLLNMNCVTVTHIIFLNIISCVAIILIEGKDSDISEAKPR